jgi:NADP-dependent 3-hydroxy acid dehydrogenase YdfG
MKVLLIGTGVLGGAVAEALAPRHEIVRASRRGEVKVDIEDKRSIEALFETVRGVDAVVVAPGGAGWGKLEALTDEDFAFSLRGKLMGQVNVVRVGLRHLRDGGSITVTSGILSRDPMPESAAVSLVNAGLEGFVRAAALNLPRGLRVNAVSPPWAKETLDAMGASSAGAKTAAEIAAAYVEAVEGTKNGMVIEP